MDQFHLYRYLKYFSESILILLLCLQLSRCQNANKSSTPEIHLVNIQKSDAAENMTLNIMLEKDPSGLKNILQLTKYVQNLSLDCYSKDPIQWVFKGFTAPLQVNLTSYRKLENETEIFIAELFIFRVSSQLTGEWSCNLVNNNKIQNSVFIFAGEHGYRGQDPVFLEYGKQREIYALLGETVIFPCISYNRNVKAKLAKRVRRGEMEIYEELQNSIVYTYDPTIGFTLQLTNGNPWGKYLCYTELSNTFDRVTILLRKKINVTFRPRHRTVEVFQNESLKLSCKTEDVGLKTEMLYPTKDHRFQLFRSPNSVGGDFAELTLSDFTYSDEGTISCHIIDPTENKIVSKHTWDYRIISEHDLRRRGWKYYYSKRLNEHTWVCWAKSSSIPSIAYVQCSNYMECNIRSACFKLGAQCDEVGARLGTTGSLLLPMKQGASGILTCNAEGLESSLWNIYIGVSGEIYNSTQELEKDALIATHDTGNETYAGTIVSLKCVGTSFQFSRGFYWTISLSSGESIRLGNYTRTSQFATLKEYVEEYDPKQGLITLISKVKVLSVHIVAIICMAPYWNSYNSSHFTLNLTVKEPTRPTFSNKDETDIDLSLGDTNQRLTCKAIGTPKPTIVWMKDGKRLPNSIIVENEGETLLLEEVTYAHHGVYSCQAENPGGSSRLRTFTLTVSDSKNNVILWVTIPGVIFILVLCIVLALFWRRIQRQKAMLRNLTDAEIEEFLYGNPDAINGSEDTNKQGHLLAYNREYEFPKDYLDIQMEEKLGSGAYGLVIKGVAKGLFPGEEETIVAIKTLQPNADITHFKALLIELKIMSSIGRHTRLVNLLGACTTDIRKREVFIIVEFCENGSLEKFLKNHRSDFPSFHNTNIRYSAEPQRSTVFYENQPGASPMRISIETLIKWSYEISEGMEYLSSKKVIHGDLAARNILLTDQLFAKIGDFGLSRQLYEYTNYVKKQQAPLPWRWMAIESLCDMEFSHKSDCWSLGITLWEIYSLGEIPYPGTNWTEEFVRKLRQGNRPPKPDLANDSIYNMMIECWRYIPADRPCFTELKTFFSKLLEQSGVLVMEPPHVPMRRKFNLEISNENYGIQREKIIVEV